MVNAGDIGTWLLKPAEQCLRQSQLTGTVSMDINGNGNLPPKGGCLRELKHE